MIDALVAQANAGPMRLASRSTHAGRAAFRFAGANFNLVVLEERMLSTRKGSRKQQVAGRAGEGPTGVVRNVTTIADIVGCFESLGDNCEFGLVQRAVGIEQLGFFRLNNAPISSLLRALRTDFGNIGDDDVELLGASKDAEYRVHIRGYDFVYHTERYFGHTDAAVLLAQQRKAVRFLVRKLLDDLAGGEKIFVRKGADSTSLEQIEPLFAELRRRGPATLLWVVPEDRTHRAGTVEVVRDGLLKGYIDRLAPATDVAKMSGVWLPICARAFEMWRGGTAGTSAATDPARIKSNLILNADRLQGTGWYATETAETRILGDNQALVPWLRRSAAVAEHVLRAGEVQVAQDLYRHKLASDLLVGETYVASLHVWIPPDFQGEPVQVALGPSPLQASPADLRQRNRWQRIWSVVRWADVGHGAQVVLQASGDPGSRLYTTAWQLERGATLRPYSNGMCQAR